MFTIMKRWECMVCASPACPGPCVVMVPVSSDLDMVGEGCIFAKMVIDPKSVSFFTTQAIWIYKGEYKDNHLNP